VIQLNLGCGGIQEPPSQGWINLDYRGPWDGTKADIVANVRFLPFKSCVFDHVYALNILEHLHREDVLSTLREWMRVLKFGGSLRVTVPDFKFAVRNYLEGNFTIERVQDIFGGQGADWNIHYIGFDELYLTSFLTQAGFKDIKNEACPYYGGLQLLSYK
jgi:predicted SAM-dependent methyltransferase